MYMIGAYEGNYSFILVHVKGWSKWRNMCFWIERLNIIKRNYFKVKSHITKNKKKQEN